MRICKTHGELPDSEFFIRKSGFCPRMCRPCERAAAREDRKRRWATPEGRRVIAGQNKRTKSVTSVYPTIVLPLEEQLFRDIRSGGLSRPVQETPETIFKALSSLKLPDLPGSLPQTRDGLRWLDREFPHRFDARTTGQMSLREALNDDNQLRKVIQYIVKSNRYPSRDLVLRNLQFSVMAPAHFFPSAATALYSDLAKGKDVFDPFLGWGGRTLGAYCAGVRRIVGTDLQKASCDGCNQISSEFARFLGTQGEFFPTDFRDFTAQTLERFDLIFTSPPFIGSENYGLGTSSIRGWTESILIPLASTCVKLLKKDGTVAIHGQDSKAAPVLSMILSTFLASGFILSGERKYGKKPGQAVLIFKLT